MPGKWKKPFGIIISLVLLCGLCWKAGNWSKENQERTLVINEVCGNNFSTADLAWKENADWIELYNATDEAISLKDWTISDDEDEIKKYRLPEIIIESKSFWVLYATGEDYVDEEDIFLNFRLSAGESIYLCDDKGNVVDSVLVPNIRQNTSYARITDAGVDWVNAYPTIGKTNASMQLVQTEFVEPPVFSIEGGFYSGVQMLELTADFGLDIYYTLDGSEPTWDSILYTEPILIENRTGEENVLAARTDISTWEWCQYAPEVLIDKITVVRAAAIDEKENKSDIITNSYLIDMENNATYDNLMTVSLTTDPDNLFDKERGIYVLGNDYEETKDLPEEEQKNPLYKRRGRKWEIPVCAEFYGADRKLLFKQDVGLRVRGNATRYLSQKPFSIYAREMYSGTDVFETDIFGNHFEYGKLIFLADRDFTKVRHELHVELLKDRDVDTQKFIRCNVFIDGEYWGVYSLAEAYDERYIENYYEIPAEEIEFNEGLWPSELVELCENPNNLSEEELYQALVNKIDLDSLMDYYAAMLYIDNYDWLPHNGYVWKSKTISESNPYQDGKWRWMVYDTEWAEEAYDKNTFQAGIVETWATDPIIKVLMTSEEFRQKFVTNFMDMANTVFEKEHVMYKIDEVFSGYSQAVEAQGVRWGDDWADEVYSDLDLIRDFFFHRLEPITHYLKEEFQLQGELVSLQLVNKNDEKGIVKLNSVIPELKNGIWNGSYFTDYPVVLSVTEKEQGSFAGWYDENQNVISKEPEITVELSSDNYYQAVFH